MESKEALTKQCVACEHTGGIYADIPDGCDCNCHDVYNYDDVKKLEGVINGKR